MSNFKKILIILLLTIPILVTTGYSAWVIINVQEDNTPPEYKYDEIITNAYGGQNKDYTGNPLGPDAMYNGTINNELIDSNSYTFEYLDTTTNTWITGLPTVNGNYTVRVINKYDPSGAGVEIYFTINMMTQKLTVNDVSVVYDGQTHYYDESTIKFDTDDDGNLIGNLEADIVISNNVGIVDVGKMVVNIHVDGNENINPYNSSVTLEILAKELDSEDIVGVVTTNYVYDGTQKKPSYADLLITYNGMILNDNHDYSDYKIISYGENTNATNGNKTASVTIQGFEDGNYTGTKIIYFDIAKANQTPTFDISKTYDGLPANITVTTNDSITSTPVVEFYDQNYELISNPSDVALNGSKYYVKVTIEGNENYNDYDSGYVEYTINPLSIKDGSISIGTIANIKCTGSELTLPKPTVTFNDNSLSETIHYTLSYYNSNNELITKIINPGTYKVRVTGIGNFNEYYDVTFSVIKNQITDTTISMNPTTYTSNQIIPTATVIYNGKTLEENKDYELSYDTIIDANSYTITINGIGIFEGTTTSTLVVNPADFANVTITVADLTYIGSQINVTPTVTFNGNKIDSDNYEFTISKDGNISAVMNAGNYEMSFTGIKNFIGTNSKSFVVAPRDVKEVSFNIPSTTYDGSNQDPAIIATYGSNSIASSNYAIEYSYSEFVNAGTYKLTIKGQNNLTGSKEVKYVINQLEITGISLNDMSVKYDGKPHVLEITGSLPAGVEAEYTNNRQTNVGNYTVTVSFKDNTGNYIVPETLTATLSITDKDDIKIELVPTTVVYNGSGQTIDINLYDSDDQLISDESIISSILGHIALTYDESTEQPEDVKYSGSTIASYNVSATFIENNSYNLSFKEGSTQSALLTINPYTLTDANVEDITETYTYDGNRKDPVLTVSYNDTILVEGSDYTTSYGANNINVVYNSSGDNISGYVEYNGEGNFTGTVAIIFAIEPATPTVDTWPTIGAFVEGGTPTLSIPSATLSDGTSGTFGFNSDVSAIAYQGTAATCTGTTQVIFTPNSNNYVPVIQDIDYTMYAVAYVGSTTYYGTIAKAVAAASAASTKKAYVVPGLYNTYGISIPVKESITIPSGVSLYVPYSGTSYNNSSNFGDDTYKSKKNYADKDQTSVDSNRSTLINLRDGADIIIENGANLYHGGEIYEFGIVGLYSEFNLGAGSMIDCSGTFYCYGYVKENSEDYANGRQSQYSSIYDNSFDEGRCVTVQETGVLETFIAMYDMKSASHLLTLKDGGVFALNLFDFPNLQTYTEVHAGGQFKTYTFLVAENSQSPKSINELILAIASSNALFDLQSGTLAMEYCPTNPEYTDDEALTRIFVNGELEQGTATISINAPFIGDISVSSNGRFLPLSYKFNVFVNEGGVYSSSHDIKFLPGSLLQINPGGTFNVNGALIIYKGENSESVIDYSNKNDARLINNGTIKVSASGSIAGLIETTMTDDSAILNFESCTSSGNFSVTSIEGYNLVEVTQVAEGYFVDSSDQGYNLYQFKAGTIVSSDPSGSQNWYGEFNTTTQISVNIVDTGYEYNIHSYEILISDYADGSNPTTIQSSTEAAGTYDIPLNKYVRINILRHAGATFDDGTAHNSSSWYYIDGPMSLTIEPSEGLKLIIKTDSASGAGNAIYSVHESSTQNGTFDQIAYLAEGDINYTVIVAKNAWFKVVIENSGMGTTALDPDKYTITPEIAKPFKVDTAYQMLESYTVYLPRKSGVSTGNCLAEGTLITMADGTKKKVEDILPGDILIVFNHETGKYETAEVLFNDLESINNYVVVNLEFSNGSVVKVIAEHGFFDLDLMKYVYIDEYNYMDYVGHRFVASTYVDGEIVQSIVTLDNAFLTEEYIRVYSPVTKYHMNYITEDILSMPGGVEGLFNIFEYDENLQYNEEQMQKDIETYGLFTYEDFKDLVSYEVYCSFPAAYFKVALGKGILTWEDLEYYIARYAPLV